MRDYANTIHRTPLVIVGTVVMPPRPATRPAHDEGVEAGALAKATRECMALGDRMTPVAVKCCSATSCT